MGQRLRRGGRARAGHGRGLENGRGRRTARRGVAREEEEASFSGRGRSRMGRGGTSEGVGTVGGRREVDGGEEGDGGPAREARRRPRPGRERERWRAGADGEGRSLVGRLGKDAG